MHDTAMEFGRMFFNSYTEKDKNLQIVDIGAQDVNGSLRSLAPQGNNYIGVDFVEGKGVDVIITDPYKLPFEDNSVDVCVSTSCFEHSEFFWLSFNEVLRILKPGGVFYLNAPSNGEFHRYPVDCWRFYPDSGLALQNWARRNGYDCCLLESFIGLQGSQGWSDYVAVFLKDEKLVANYPNRIQNSLNSYTNGLVYGRPDFSNFSAIPQDMKAHYKLKNLVKAFNEILKS